MGFLTRRSFCSALSLLAVAGSTTLGASPTEYQVKAVFLFNFTQFVEWPESAFGDASSPIIIGVLGSDPFGTALEEAIQGETVNGRPLSIRRYASVEAIDDCHVLFFNLPASQNLSAALGSMRQRNVLTVSDAKEFARAGGVIELMTINNKIRLQINVDAAKLANLTISSKLLRPARIVWGVSPSGTVPTSAIRNGDGP
jgi:YfiR/HmsC-like